MFDNLGDDNSQGDKKKGEQDQNYDFEGQEMTDSPFRVKSDKDNPNLKKQDQANKVSQKSFEPEQGKEAKEPEDMFSSLGSGSKVNLENRNQQEANNFQEAITQAAPPNSSAQEKPAKKLAFKPSKKELIIWIILFVVVAGVIAGSFYWISGFLGSTPDDYQYQNEGSGQESLQSEKEATDSSQNQEASGEGEDVELPQEEEEEEEDFSQPQDTDGDGLTDEQEREIGTEVDNPDTDGDGLNDREEFLTYKTNPLKADTDDDGLNDYEEIRVYGTEPSNPDTDGDGYLDGEEVESGYNPRGEGELQKNINN